ncbi:hypothetical protein [Roseinatronobacter alkalisoli]|uniref:Uncharacterized protein n=1 Tax=Roseinatronobacter alkalisoli TaxID=3028235 RepID=A0ABT5TER9_9RHOB|nr:hypothetical protein [Roseinatronobacter sp. HJB301]MDD7972871.1 hypothetical protein [Roseinatronobacter sp. HJB301]
MADNFGGAGFQTANYTITGSTNSYDVEQALVYVVELDRRIAEETGLDMVSLASAGVDAYGVAQVKNSLGLSGRAYVKTHAGKQYLILKGNPRQRPVLRGTRYLASNPQVAHITVGARSIARAAGRVTGIVFVAYTALNVVEHLMTSDDPRLSSLLGNIAADMIKFFVAAGAGVLAGILVGTLTTVVAGPLVAAIFVGVASGILLDRLDRQYGLTEKLILAIEAVQVQAERPFARLAREIAAWERWFIDKAVRQSIRFR